MLSTASEHAKQLFSLSSEKRINYQLELKSREAIMVLLAMTPYFWNIDLKTKTKVEALDLLWMWMSRCGLSRYDGQESIFDVDKYVTNEDLVII